MRPTRELSKALMLVALFVAVDPSVKNGPFQMAEAAAATPSTRQALTNIVLSLRALDKAYASGRKADATANYNQARASWTSVSSSLSKKEAGEIESLFNTLGEQLQKEATASDVSATVSDLADELGENMGKR